MSSLGVWHDRDIKYEAETCSDLMRQIVILCSPSRTIGYTGLAKKTGVSYAEAQRIGWDLQGKNLAEIKLLAPGYAGRGIFLNDNGERLRKAIIARCSPEL